MEENTKKSKKLMVCDKEELERLELKRQIEELNEINEGKRGHHSISVLSTFKPQKENHGLDFPVLSPSHSRGEDIAGS